jgi:hypothetical protein
MQCLSQFVAAEKVSVAQLTAIGALKDVTLMYVDWEKNDYLRIQGGRHSDGGSPRRGARATSTRSDRDGKSPHLRKIKDKDSGLPLIRPAA